MTTEESSSEEVVALLNAAQISSNTDSAKLDNLRKVQEIIVNRDSNLLDNFLENQVFQNLGYILLRHHWHKKSSASG